MLVTEKNTGNVYRVIKGNVSGPLIHIDVASKEERGLLGVAVSKIEDSKDDNHDPYVYLYYTQCQKIGKKSSQNCANYVNRYEFNSENNTLINPKLILNLSALPGPSHNGGGLELDKDMEGCFFFHWPFVHSVHMFTLFLLNEMTFLYRFLLRGMILHAHIIRCLY